MLGGCYVFASVCLRLLFLSESLMRRHKCGGGGVLAADAEGQRGGQSGSPKLHTFTEYTQRKQNHAWEVNTCPESQVNGSLEKKQGSGVSVSPIAPKTNPCVLERREDMFDVVTERICTTFTGNIDILSTLLNLNVQYNIHSQQTLFIFSEIIHWLFKTEKKVT